LKVGLFVTCLVDLFRPQIGFAAIKLLEQMNCTVVVPPQQTCCGQPAYNGGDRVNAKKISQQVIKLFADYDYIVIPSGSCAGMLRKHYPSLWSDHAEMFQRANALAAKTYELTAFLTDIVGMKNVNVSYAASLTYHDSCSGLRELDIKQQPRNLLATVAGLTLRELPDCETCCGFGGMFCVKYPAISNKMLTDKIANVQATNVDVLAAGDLGCLMNMAGKLKRDNSPIKVFHIAEILAGMTDNPAIGEGMQHHATAK